MKNTKLPKTLCGISIVLSIATFACKKDKTTSQNSSSPTNVTVPVVATSTVSNVTDSSATSGGSISANGGSSIISAGLCWDTVSNPNINGHKTSDYQNATSFVSQLKGLLPNHTYFVRAYATNSSGTAYGSEYSFTTTKSSKWIAWSNGLSEKNIFEIISAGNDLYAATANGVFKSTGGQNNWTAAGLSGKSVNTLMYANNTLYAGTQNGVYISTDNGVSWISRNNGFNVTYPPVIELAYSGNKIYANCFASGWKDIYMSSDNGQQWNLITNLSGIEVNGIEVVNGSLYFFDGIQSNVRVSANDGANWSIFSALPGKTWPDNRLLFLDTKLFGCTDKGFYAVEASGPTTFFGQPTGFIPCYAAVKHNGSFVIGLTNDAKFSSDGGASWTSLTTGLTSSNGIGRVKTLKSFNGNLFAGTNVGGVFKLIE